jgi:hypothetical protein
MPQVIFVDAITGLGVAKTSIQRARLWCSEYGSWKTARQAARNLGLPKLTFKVIRRTIATLAQKKGTVKDVQGVLRHSRTATTTEVYVREIPDSVRARVNAINAELRSKPNSHRLAPWANSRVSFLRLRTVEIDTHPLCPEIAVRVAARSGIPTRSSPGPASRICPG